MLSASGRGVKGQNNCCWDEGGHGAWEGLCTGQRLVIASKALHGQKALLFADGDLLGGAVHLAADAFGNLLNFPAGFQEGFDLCVDRGAGFHGWSRLGFAVGCFYAHDGH